MSNKRLEEAMYMLGQYDTVSHIWLNLIVFSSFFQVPIPQAPMSFSPSVTIPERLEKIQNYMNTLQYPFLT